MIISFTFNWQHELFVLQPDQGGQPKPSNSAGYLPGVSPEAIVADYKINGQISLPMKFLNWKYFCYPIALLSYHLLIFLLPFQSVRLNPDQSRLLSVWVLNWNSVLNVTFLRNWVCHTRRIWSWSNCEKSSTANVHPQVLLPCMLYPLGCEVTQMMFGSCALGAKLRKVHFCRYRVLVQFRRATIDY